MWKNWNSHTLLLEVNNCIATLENQDYLPKLIICLLYDPWPIHFTSGHISRSNECIYTQKDMYKFSSNSFIYNSPNWNQPKYSSFKKIAKIVEYLYNAIALNNNRKTHLWHQNNTNDSQIYNFKQKKPDPKRSQTEWLHSDELQSVETNH